MFFFGHLKFSFVLFFQHPFVSKVTSNRALRELVAEAKAEVMEEIEESRDEAEEDDSSESASVSSLTSVPVLGENFSSLQKLFFRPCWVERKWLLGQGGAGFWWLPRAWRNNGAGRVIQCPLTGGAHEKWLRNKRKRKKRKISPDVGWRSWSGNVEGTPAPGGSWADLPLGLAL